MISRRASEVPFQSSPTLNSDQGRCDLYEGKADLRKPRIAKQAKEKNRRIRSEREADAAFSFAREEGWLEWPRDGRGNRRAIVLAE